MTDPYSDLPLGYHNSSLRYRHDDTSSENGTIRTQRKMDNHHPGRNHLLPNTVDVGAHDNLANVQPMHCESDLVPDALRPSHDRRSHRLRLHVPLTGGYH